MTEKQTSVLARGLKLDAPRSVYFLIFAISGFSGLIYESIWSHYLKLFLGHAAYAQSLVLIIFMGGMALGSWFASRFSAKSKSPLLLYAAVELVVGLAALLFHDLFTSMIEVFYSSVLPSMDSPTAGAIMKWLAASVLIMPQSVLLGMTFPLMSAGIIRRFPETPGGSIAMLYFTNSIGAAIGVLASGFWLIQLVGLPGTILTAGILNIVLAATVWALLRLDSSPQTAAISQAPSTEDRSSLKQLFLVAAFITGAASFIYEISWIRMLSLVLGATSHSFELMLSAFITGLAFGGLWIKRRIDRIASPVRFSGYVQLVMGVLALLTIPVFVSSFDWMAWLLRALDTTNAGYVGYSFASHAIALSVMLPTTFLAGMTLPLFTFVLIRKGDGERSIGQIYAANTIGAIVGVLAAVHIGLPVLGLKMMIVIGAMLDIVLGLVLLSREPVTKSRRFELVAASLVGVGGLALTVGLVDLDKKLLTSGVYRNGSTATVETDKVVFYQDGKTASVSLLATAGGMVVLSTNGKPDASIQFNPSRPASRDEVTMAMAGTLPFAYMPNAKLVANIGMGSGLTTHAMLAHNGLEKIDTIEIESAMVAAAAGYGEFVERAYQDPRSEIHIEDAKTFFSLHNSVYDIIVAEPSNPWVSGVASLFSTEFYRTVKRHLRKDGLFVQWIQLYEFNDDLAVSILKALTENFSDYVIYTTDSSNILLIAKNEGRLPKPDWSAVFETGLGKDLSRVNINSESDMIVRNIVDRDSFAPFLSRSSVPANSDYFPYVDLNAGRARYLGFQSAMFPLLMTPPLPVNEMLTGEQVKFSKLSESSSVHRVDAFRNASWILQRLTSQDYSRNAATGKANVRPELKLAAEVQANAGETCDFDGDPGGFLLSVHSLMTASLAVLDPEQAALLVDSISDNECAVLQDNDIAMWMDLYHAIARRDAAGMSTSAHRLLADDESTPIDIRNYVVGTGMLGDIVEGRPENALSIWRAHEESVIADGNIPMYLLLIASIALDAEGSTLTQANAAAR